MTYDIIILGSGPAGLAAAVAARGRNKSVLVAGNPWQDSPLARAERVDNYPGLPGRTGLALLEEFYRHASGLGADFVVGKVLALLAWNGFSLVGLAPDAPQEANYLHSLGCQVVYVAPRQPQGLDETIPYVKAGRLAVRGERTVTGLEADGALLPCAGVFILRRAVAPTDLLPALETEEGVIRVDRRMATSVPGVFAAGDCTGGPLQVSKAVGEGHVAALSACEYLDTL